MSRLLLIKVKSSPASRWDLPSHAEISGTLALYCSKTGYISDSPSSEFINMIPKLTPEQESSLNNWFERNQRPTKKEKASMCQLLELSEKEVDRWYREKRYFLKRSLPSKQKIDEMKTGLDLHIKRISKSREIFYQMKRKYSKTSVTRDLEANVKNISSFDDFSEDVSSFKLLEDEYSIKTNFDDADFLPNLSAIQNDDAHREEESSFHLLSEESFPICLFPFFYFCT